MNVKSYKKQFCAGFVVAGLAVFNTLSGFGGWTTQSDAGLVEVAATAPFSSIAERELAPQAVTAESYTLMATGGPDDRRKDKKHAKPQTADAALAALD